MQVTSSGSAFWPELKGSRRETPVLLTLLLGCKCDMLSSHHPQLLPQCLQRYSWIYPQIMYQNKLFLPNLFLAVFDHSSEKDNEYSCFTPFISLLVSRVFIMGNVICLPDNCQILFSVLAKSTLPNIVRNINLFPSLTWIMNFGVDAEYWFVFYQVSLVILIHHDVWLLLI